MYATLAAVVSGVERETAPESAVRRVTFRGFIALFAAKPHLPALT